MATETTKAASRKTLTVACKLPHGLLLRVGRMIDRDEPVMGGGTKIVKKFQPVGVPILINGYAAPYGRSPACNVAGGFALTPNIDAEQFMEWLAQNERHPAVVAGLIFAATEESDAAAKARDGHALRNGLEPLAQAGDPRVPRAIKTYDAKAA